MIGVVVVGFFAVVAEEYQFTPLAESNLKDCPVF